jgi:hypothetical protein
MNFPFQPDAGIQTSILMSESVDGFNLAATRQNAGRPLAACTKAVGGGVPPAAMGIVSAPASTARASVIVVFGSTKDARLSHVWPAAWAATAAATSSAAAVALPVKKLLISSPFRT